MNELGAHLANSLASASIHTNERVIVACSGGVDSVVLLHLAVHYFAANHIVVAHANHGLRGSESDGDASFVQDLTSSLGCEFVTTMLPVFEDVATSGRSIEESARVLRYEWLESVRLVHGASTVLVAHHLDDLVETMLYRIARGTGLRGLRAMRPRQGNIVRPLLGISRAEIESYARQHGLSWREDASNQDTSIHRNLLRHEVLPKLQTINPAYARAFERLSRYAQDVSEFIDDAVQEFLGDGDYFSILLFQERSDFFQREVIRYLYEQACDSTIGLSESSIWEILRFIYNTGNPTKKSLGNLSLHKTGDRVYHRNHPSHKIPSMSEKSIFTRIVEGEIPCYKIYEDDLVLAFLDINPIALGHTLVIPKAQIDRFEDVPAHIAANLFISAQKIARAIKQATGSARIGMVIAGFDVPHTHIHLIPANTMADIDFARASKREDAEMKEVMERIILSLS